MTRTQLLRDLDQMSKDAQGMCGCMDPEAADAQRERYKQAGLVIRKILEGTSPHSIRGINATIERRRKRSA